MNGKVVFHHVRNVEEIGRGGRTLAILLNEEGFVTRYAVARCHLKDNFCKRTGRVKAEGRLKSKAAIDVGPEQIDLKTFLSISDIV